CDKLKTLNLSNFNTANVTNFSHMFSSCDALTSVRHFKSSFLFPVSRKGNNACCMAATLALTSRARVTLYATLSQFPRKKSFSTRCRQNRHLG
ncbi:MAG: hypothetical protein HFJ71_08505, partial [Eggerthellaceae bacterium]|nr:hypothetical protein [Eggerthellaceae bacterium]